MKPIKICIVEDLKEIREGMVMLLSLDERFEMLKAFSDAESATKELPQWQPDVVIMDINLPGMSGIDCVRIAKKSNIRTQFMMFTVYENDEKVFEALKAGASGYLLKNTGMHQIIEALKELYEGGSPMSSNIARKLVNNFQEKTHYETKANITLLSIRENETLHLLSQGLLYKEIADQLGVSVKTVGSYDTRIKEKLGLENAGELMREAVLWQDRQHGL